jgi:hypothetical protein
VGPGPRFDPIPQRLQLNRFRPKKPGFRAFLAVFRQFRTKKDRFIMKKLLGSLAALLASFALTACGDDAPLDSGRNQPDPIEPEMQKIYDELGIDPEGKYDPDHRQRIDYAPGESPDDPESDEEPRRYDPSEKAVIAPLQGWSLTSILAFQDGQPQVVEGVTYQDMCTNTTGGICDNEWHAQAKYLDFGSTGQNTFQMLNGLCGVANNLLPDGEGNEWRACALPKITLGSGHNLTWRFNRTSCPSAMRPQFDLAITQAHQRMVLGGLTFTQITTPAMIEYRCSNLWTEGAMGEWVPTGPLTARWAAPEDFEDQCESGGFVPPPPGSYYQGIDMFYYYGASQIRLDSTELAAFSARCGMTTTGLVNLISNTIIHEVGHLAGFTHQLFDGGGLYDVMHEEADCNAATSMWWHPFMQEAVKQLDVRLNANLQVIDQDISCLSPTKNNN